MAERQCGRLIRCELLLGLTKDPFERRPPVPPGRPLEIGDEQFMLTPYLTPIFMARLCQPPYEFLSPVSLEHDPGPFAKLKMTIFLLTRKEKALAPRFLPGPEGRSTGPRYMTIQVTNAKRNTVLRFFPGMSVAARCRFAVDDVIAGFAFGDSPGHWEGSAALPRFHAGTVVNHDFDRCDD